MYIKTKEVKNYMLGLLGDFLGIIIAFAVWFGILCTITGEDAKGVTIITNTVTAMILYAVILSVFNFDGTGNGVFRSAIPMIKGFCGISYTVTDNLLCFKFT